ncbi:MAG: hypothetical protein ACI4CT_08315 [Lachnospiraceae bacterium]
MHGLDFMKQMKLAYADYTVKSKELEKLDATCKQQKKKIAAEEKNLEKDISAAIQKEQAIIENSFQQQLANQDEKLRQVRDERNQKKNRKINERVEIETAGIKEQNQSLHAEFCALLKQNHVPNICRSDWYYILFMTKGIREICLLFLLILAGMVGLPALICLAGYVSFLMDATNPAFDYAVIFGVVDVLILLVYIVVLNLTKAEYKNVLKEGRIYKDKIYANRRHMATTKDVIMKDKNTIDPELAEYDDRRKQLLKERKGIEQEKEAALDYFQKETKIRIEEEVRRQREEGLNRLRVEQQSLEDAYKRKAAEAAALSEQIRTEYEPVLGKEFAKPSKIDLLIQIMEEGDAATLEEAIEVYRG